MPQQEAAGLSVARQFKHVSVLLTGATGYIGGLVLEKLLRSTEVAVVYVLLRTQGNSSAADRLSQLLQGNIFQRVRDQQTLLQKVLPVTGDISQPGLGISPADRDTLVHNVHVILHSAADIRLEADIHSTLTSNYLGTKAILQLATNCKQLKAFVHISSCFANMNQPRSTVVYEQLYPLKFGTSEVDHQTIVQDLLSLPSAAAEVRATALRMRWGFPNNYTFSKHLAEQLVSSYKQHEGVPAAIVRPSLVSSVAYDPIPDDSGSGKRHKACDTPGYIGNWAGPIGASAALAIGFYHSLGCVSSQPLHVWDCMPADLVANAVLVTAAAMVAGSADSIAQQAAEARASTADRILNKADSSSTVPPMLIVQSSSSSTYPLSLLEGWNHAVEFITKHKPRFRLCWSSPPQMTADFKPDPAVVGRERWWTAVKVAVVCRLLRLFGMRKAAARLRSGFDALCVYGTSKTDKDLVFSADVLQLLEQALSVSEKQQYRLVMRPGMPLPSAAAAGHKQGKNSRSNSNAADSATLHEVAQQASDVDSSSSRQEQEQKQFLTWRRYYHTQLAAVYSKLFHLCVPQSAQGPGGQVLQHDFCFVR